GAEAVLTMELDELEEFGRSVEADDESLARILMNLGLKKMIVDKIVLYLRGKKKVTKDDILSEMKDFDLTMPGDIDQFSFHLHPDFIEEVLDDLRKIKVIQGKDTKIRYTRE
ncbi:MAG: hypothetical protein LUP99_01975, partial [Methanomicrobiales archaeon]|nr:hypothetical protein [Methanomicrobiales archaeon]